MPSARSRCFSAGMAISPEWNTLAASAASTPAVWNTSVKCSGGPGAAGGHQGHLANAAHRAELGDIIAPPYAVAGHTVEYNLARPALLHLGDPLERIARRVAGAMDVTGELLHSKALCDRLAVDAHHHALRAEALAERVYEVGLR